jgi:O-antigen/teichoic acid export membrane protein
MKDLKQKTIRGGLAKMCAQAANLLVRVGSLMVLARLLDPRDFGLVGMVTAVTGVLSLFRDFGLSTATIQRSEISDEQFSTLFWVNIAIGTVLALVSMALAPAIAAFYHEPRLVWVTIVSASGFILNAAGVQHTALLQRSMRFTVLSAVDVISLVLSTGAGIVMAMRGYGYWALVAMTLLGPLVTALGVWIATAWMPGLPRKVVGLGSMVRFGGTVTLNGLVVYVAYNLEKVLLGRYWGAETVGIYGRAYQLINIPTDNVNSAVGGVAFPALSRLQNDAERLKNYFLKFYSFVLAITIPTAILCALFGNDLILVVLGQKWNEAAPIFRLLAPTMLALALINPFGWLLLSLGLVGRSLKIALVIAPLVTTAYFLGLPHGPKGVALGYSVAMMLWVVPHIAWCIHGTPISFRDIAVVVSRPAASGALGAALACGAHFWLGPSLTPFVRLVMDASVLLGAYAGMLLFVMGQKAFYIDLVRGLRRQPAVDERVLVSA